jgi:hypothetical protein
MLAYFNFSFRRAVCSAFVRLGLWAFGQHREFSGDGWKTVFAANIPSSPRISIPVAIPVILTNYRKPVEIAF